MGSTNEDDVYRVDTIDDLDTGDGDEFLNAMRSWNATSRHVVDTTLVELLDARLEKTPDAVAVIFDDVAVTYRDLHTRANQLAHVLLEEGAGPEKIVAVALPRSIDLVVSLLAVLKSGAAYLPLDTEYPPDRLSFMLDDSSPVALITYADLSTRFAGKCCRVILDDAACQNRLSSASGGSPGHAVQGLRLRPEHPVYVIYTSGSTGRPKGVINTHAGLVNRLTWMQAAYGLDTGDVVLQKTPCSFDVSVWEFFWPLIEGATLLLARPGGHKDPAYLIHQIQTYGVTTIHFVPSMLRVFLDAPGVVECDSLRRVISSGEALPASLQQRFHTLLPCALHNLYGPTEAAIDVTSWTCEAGEVGSEVPIGRPIWNTQVYVLDNYLRPVPANSEGELYLAGQGLARGYHGRPGLTAERFIANPFDTRGGRMYRTGDRARRRPDGVVEYLGRVDQQVKLRGYRIELGEIEAALLSCDAVGDAAVTLREDLSGDKQLVAYVTPSRSHALPVLNMLNPDQPNGISADEDRRLYTFPNGLTVFHQNPNESRFIYDEIFNQEIYLRNGIDLRDGDCVVDVGANIGLFSLFVAQRCPNATVYAFEPLPPVFASLKRNAAVYGIKGHVYECGLSHVAGEATFRFYPNDTLISSSCTTEEEARSIVRSYLHNQQDGSEQQVGDIDLEAVIDARLKSQSYTCRLRTLSEIIAESSIERIDLLKIDVENAETEVLRGIDESDWARISQVVVEVHDVDDRLALIESMLVTHGFTVEVVQETLFRSTDVYNLYARRSGRGKTHPGLLPRTEWTWTDVSSFKQDIRAHVARYLPDYMVPSILVPLHAMPLMPNGKLDRSALPSPDLSCLGMRAYEAPAGEHELRMAGLWGALLGIENIGRNDHFFELGGHSLMASRVISRVRREYGVQLPLGRFFDTPVLKDFTALVHDPEARSGPRTPALVRAGLQRAPLSFPQEMLYLEDQLNPGLLCYNVTENFRIAGELDLRALEWALTEIVSRHESLRTRFVLDGEHPVQRVDPSQQRIPLPVFDLSGCSRADEREARIHELQTRIARGVFSLESGPLLRAVVIQSGEYDYRLLLVVHHIATDGWGQGILHQELGTLYRAFGRGTALPDLRLQYTDYAVWQRARVRGTMLDDSLAYWARKLENANTNVSFPTDRPRPKHRSFLGARQPVHLTTPLSVELKIFCRQRGVTPFMLFLTVLKILLFRMTAETDIIVGSAFSERADVDAEALIGNMTNTVALRSDLGGRPTFNELLTRVARTTLDAHQHSHVPFQTVVQNHGADRLSNQNPFFRATLVLENTPGSQIDLGDALTVKVETLDIGTCIDEFGLTLVESEHGFSGFVEYSVDLYEASSIRAVIASYVTLLEDAITHPKRFIDELTLLPAEQRAQLMVTGKGPEKARDGSLFVERFQRTASHHESEPALFLETESVSYGELNGRANRLAHYLVSKGVGPEVSVGVLLERGLDLYVAVLATMKAGGVYVPLDPAYPQDRLHQMSSDAGVYMLLVAGDTAHLAPTGAWSNIDLQTVRESLAAQPVADFPSRVSADNLAYIMYTSGSTGVPKAVGISHDALANQLQWLSDAFHLTAADRFLHKASICFDSSIEEMLAPLSCGAKVIAARPRGEYDVSYLSELIERQGVTCIDLAPSLLDALLDVSSRRAWRSVRMVVSGGEVLNEELAGTFRKRVDAVLLNTYGPTEATVQVTWTPDLHANNGVAIGRPIDNTQLYVVDGRMQLVPMGAYGELYIGGDGVARGYVNQAAATGENFVPDPFGKSGGRLYRTGDRVRWREDGQLEFRGRIDQQVKLRGYRIEPGEIERALEDHPHVVQAVVVLREDAAHLPQLAAYVVTDDSITFTELRDALRNRLPRYMVPTHWANLERLPLNSNGKIDRKKLPEPVLTLVAAEHVAPRNELEVVICSVFGELLDWDNVGIHDNFFDIGGHSLSATRAVSRLSVLLGATLPVRLIFETPTVSGLAQAVDKLIATSIPGGPAASSADQASVLDGERLLSSLEALSEDEVELLLGQMEEGMHK